MSEFFQDLLADDNANKIQMISIWFELTGLILVLMEILKPKYLRSAEQKINTYVSKNMTKWGALEGLIGHAFGVVLLYIFIFIVYVVMKFFNAGDTVGIIFVFIFGIIALILTITFIIHVFNSILQFLNAISKGKALGSFGLILSIVGFLMELYQVMILKKDMLL